MYKGGNDRMKKSRFSMSIGSIIISTMSSPSVSRILGWLMGHRHEWHVVEPPNGGHVGTIRPVGMFLSGEGSA